MANSKNHQGPDQFSTLHERFKRGDIIGISGNPGRTKTGELSLSACQMQLLSPCLFMLPTEASGLKDKETRYR